MSLSEVRRIRQDRYNRSEKFKITKTDYDKELINHKEYLAKNNFEVNLPLNYFNAETLHDLQKYGHWYQALNNGDIKPITSFQQKFVNLINGKYELLGVNGTSWIRYLSIKEKWGNLFFILSQSNREERKILASILKIESYKPEDIIDKLSSASQNLNGFLGDLTSYNEILLKVSKKLELKHIAKDDHKLERQISQHILNEALSKMDMSQKEKLEEELSKIKSTDNSLMKTGGILATLTAANLSGFGVYLLATTTLGTLSGIIGVTLPFAVYTTLTSSIAFITGPVGWIGLGVYSLWKFTDVDYKVLIPSIVYIHWLREKYSPN